jgi:hypothetical protein
MNPIGLPATRQLEILSNCHDRYTLECRPVGVAEWMPTAGYRDPLDAPAARRVVAELNALSERVVYRAVLVQSGEFPATTMTDVQLEEYMALVASKIEVLGEHYVNRQVEWAEELLRQRGVV